MHSLIDSRALLRITLAGALVFTATACSRPDRADAGRDTSQTANIGTGESQIAGQDTARAATQADTAAPGTVSASTEATPPARSAPEPENVSGYQPMGQDTADTALAHRDTVAVGDSANVGKPGERLEANETSEQANADSLANQPESDRVRPPEDSSETIGVTTDTASGAGITADTTTAAAMTRDTSPALAQGDTAMQQPSEVAVETADSTAIQATVDTTTAEPQVEAKVATETTADTVAVVGDSAEIGKAGERLEANETTTAANADTVATETERVRPPEDSTELHGNVTETVTAETGNAEVGTDTVSVAAEADTAAAAAAVVSSTGDIATGPEAVALMSREGRRCLVADGDRSRDAQWDLAGSPATMNPCGTGTMTLPRVQTEK
jgi:hypothetical protein